jgi:S-formylglutathione hydrolase FrmB
MLPRPATLRAATGSRRPHRALVAFLAGVAAFACSAATGATPASAAARVQIVDVPSTAGNIDLTRAKLNKLGEIAGLQARVLLPDGYDDNPGKAWPVLYLLHGVGDYSGTWLRPDNGDLAAQAKGFQGIVVMPEAGRSYYTDAWIGGTRQGANWERYELDEVVPQIESTFRIAPGRQNHAIGGLSMGGYGAVLLAAQLPSYFGTAVSMSGLLDLESDGAQYLVPNFSAFSYKRTWGPFHGPYAQAHNPMKLLDNLEDTRVYVSVGNGNPDLYVANTIASVVLGGPSEAAAYVDARNFTFAARGNGNTVTYQRHQGLHSWPYWRHEIARVLRWGPFGVPAGDESSNPTSWTYRTMAPHGNAWGLGFRFAAPPKALLTLTRSGQTLTASGTGTITVTPGAGPADASGGGSAVQCAFTATLPFTRELPAGC